MSGQPGELPCPNAEPSQGNLHAFQKPQLHQPICCLHPRCQLQAVQTLMPATKPFSLRKNGGQHAICVNTEYIVRSHSCKDRHRPPSSERAARRAALPKRGTQPRQPPCVPKAPAPSTYKSPTSQMPTPGSAKLRASYETLFPR